MDFTVYQRRKGCVTDSSTLTHLWSLLLSLATPSQSETQRHATAPHSAAPGPCLLGSGDLREDALDLLCRVQVLELAHP